MNNDQIFEFFEDLVHGKKPNGKFQLARIYGAYEREQQEIEKNEVIEGKLRKNKMHIIHRITDDMAIIQCNEDLFHDGRQEWFCFAYKDNISNSLYDSFDKAMIALVAKKTGNPHASEYIFKMLDM